MNKNNLSDLDSNNECSLEFVDEEKVIDNFNSNIEEYTKTNRFIQIQFLKRVREFFVSSNLKPHNKKKRNQFLTMEEKKQMVLNGEQVPVCVGKSEFNSGPVKYYSRTLKKKMKI